MFCQFCGSQVGEAVLDCPSCGRHFAAPAAPAAALLTKQVKDSSRDAAAAFRSLFVDPISGLPLTYDRLGQQRAQAAGLVFALGFALATAIGLTMGARNLFGGFFGMVSSNGLGTFFKVFLALLVLPAALIAAAYGLRRLLHSSEESPAADIFTVGTALAPLALAVLLGGLLGIGNFEVALLLLLFGNTYLVLMLYKGLTSIGKLSERAGAPAVPVLLVLAAWLSKIVFSAFF